MTFKYSISTFARRTGASLLCLLLSSSIYAENPDSAPKASLEDLQSFTTTLTALKMSATAFYCGRSLLI